MSSGGSKKSGREQQSGERSRGAAAKNRGLGDEGRARCDHVSGGEGGRRGAEVGSRDGHSHGSWRVQVSGVQGGMQAAAMHFWPKRDKVTNFVREARKQSLKGAG